MFVSPLQENAGLPVVAAGAACSNGQNQASWASHHKLCIQVLVFIAVSSWIMQLQSCIISCCIGASDALQQEASCRGGGRLHGESRWQVLLRLLFVAYDVNVIAPLQYYGKSACEFDLHMVWYW